MVPEDCTPVGVVAVVAWMTPDGGYHWKPYANMDAPTSQVIGTLFGALLHYAMQPGYLPQRKKEEDEDSGG